MQTTLKYWIPALLLLGTTIFSACEKEVKFEIPESEKGLVLNALMRKDSSILVRVSYLKSLNDRQTRLAGAVVKLYRDDEWVEDLLPTTINKYPYYTSSTNATPGHLYRITATVEGYGTIEGTDYIPESPQTSAEEIFNVPDPQNGLKVHLHFTLHDAATTKNYYRLRVMARQTWGQSDSTLYPREFRFKNADMGETTSDGNRITYVEYFFEDGNFNGSAKNIQLELFGNDFGTGIDTTTYQLEVTALTENSYHYLRTRDAARDNDNDPFTEPSSVFTNIKNGQGIVGGIAYRLVGLKP